MFGKFFSARTMAKPMRCVNEILPPRVRLRWLLMTIRLSASSLAGTARTLVAVGTLSEASMFCTIRAATPLSGTFFSGTPSPATLAGAAAFGCAAALDGFAAAGVVAVAAGAAGAAGAADGDAAAGAALAGAFIVVGAALS